MTTRPGFEEIFERHAGRPVDKWRHYFEIYDTHLGKFRGRPVTMLEIGVQKGGSLQLWREFLGPDSRIVGIDIDPSCKAHEAEGIEIMIGDQGDRAFLASVIERAGPFDIVLDDGSHHMDDLSASFSTLFGHVTNGGVYLAEDLHTCYWEGFGGGHGHPNSFIEKLKRVIDDLHALHSQDTDSFAMNAFTFAVKGMHFYDSIAVIDKTQRFDAETGQVDMPTLARTGKES